MVGQLGDNAMASVGVINQLNFIIILVTFGAMGGAGVLTAQFFGSRITSYNVCYTKLLRNQKGWPVLVLLDHTQVIGFTGPLSVETSGRGYFAGIGVDQGYQGKGP